MRESIWMSAVTRWSGVKRKKDEDGYRDVTGPDWIIDNLPCYGG